MGRKPIHLIEDDERKNVTKIDKLFIDLGLSGDEVKKRVRIGDPITFDVGLETFGDDLAVSRAFDDKMGAWISARVLEEVKKAGGAPGDLIAAATVQEEVGLRGGTTSAYGVDPQVGIAVEVGHATDYPDIDKRKHGEATCGDGPIIARGPNINPALFDLLVEGSREGEGALPARRRASRHRHRRQRDPALARWQGRGARLDPAALHAHADRGAVAQGSRLRGEAADAVRARSEAGDRLHAVVEPQ